jgi:hypothetical protein
MEKGTSLRGMKISEVTDEDLSLWIAEKFRETNFRAWHENPNMVTDPAMTVMLLEKMAANCDEPCLFHEIRESNTGWFAYVETTTWRRDEIVLKTLGRAVAEAFALASGWTD